MSAESPFPSRTSELLRPAVSGGISGIPEYTTTQQDFMERKERATRLSLELNRAINSARELVKNEYSDGDIYTPPEETGFTWVEGTGLFIPDYGREVLVLGQTFNAADTHIIVEQFLPGEQTDLGQLIKGITGTETKFHFDLLVREKGSWVKYDKLTPVESVPEVLVFPSLTLSA
jgi:hypothetical protein